jgi:hypothetical protein
MSSLPNDDDRRPVRRTDRCVGVTVRTPAGASSAFAVEPDDTAGQLTVRALRHFERLDMIEPGAFRIGLLRGNAIVDLEIDTLLLPAGVVEGDVLHLLTSEPQVDGAGGVAGVTGPVHLPVDRAA